MVQPLHPQSRARYQGEHNTEEQPVAPCCVRAVHVPEAHPYTASLQKPTWQGARVWKLPLRHVEVRFAPLTAPLSALQESNDHPPWHLQWKSKGKGIENTAFESMAQSLNNQPRPSSLPSLPAAPTCSVPQCLQGRCPPNSRQGFLGHPRTQQLSLLDSQQGSLRAGSRTAAAALMRLLRRCWHCHRLHTRGWPLGHQSQGPGRKPRDCRLGRCPQHTPVPALLCRWRQ